MMSESDTGNDHSDNVSDVSDNLSIEVSDNVVHADADVDKFKEWVNRNFTKLQTRLDMDANANTVGGPGFDDGGLMRDPELAAAAPGQPVVSNGKLVGPNAQAALNQDWVIQQARASGNSDQLHQALQAGPATGCAMVLTLAMQASGFNPADPANAGNFNGFQNYSSEVLQCPVFSQMIRDAVQPGMSGDWGSVVNQILSLYVGIAPNDLQHIQSGLMSMAQAASSNPSTVQTQNLFVQNTLNAGNQLIVYMYQSVVRMVTNVQSGGKHSPDTVTNNAGMQLFRTVLAFNTGAWPAYAHVIMDKTTASLNDWLNNTTTPQGTIPVNWNS
jgi:hypothetical protein